MINARDFAFVGCRLMAVYFLWVALRNLGTGVWNVQQALTASGEHATYIFFGTASYLAALVADLGMSMILWFGADRVAGKVVAGTTETSENAPVDWSRHAVLTLALILLGLWILISHLPSLFTHLPVMLNRLAEVSSASGSNVSWSYEAASVLAIIVSIGLGIFCVFTPRAIAEFIGRLRRW